MSDKEVLFKTHKGLLKLNIRKHTTQCKKWSEDTAPNKTYRQMARMKGGSTSCATKEPHAKTAIKPLHTHENGHYPAH